MVEFEIVERRGNNVFSKLVQKGSLRLKIGEEEDPRIRKTNIIRNFDATLRSFKRLNIIEICSHDKGSEAISQILRDEEVINLAVNDRSERVK